MWHVMTGVCGHGLCADELQFPLSLMLPRAISTSPCCAARRIPRTREVQYRAELGKRKGPMAKALLHSR